MSKHKPMGYAGTKVPRPETETMPYGDSVTVTVDAKKPPGHQEATLLGLQAELVSFNQRLTGLEKELTEKVDASRKSLWFLVEISLGVMLVTLCGLCLHIEGCV